MLNLIKKVHFDRYDQQGKKIPDNSKHENTFHPFVDAPIPLPNGDKNIILLFCENIRDGVGDYQHLQNYYYRVKALVGEHYIVRPILTANKTPVKPKAKTYVIHQLGNANQDRVIQAYHELCKTEGIEPLLNLEFNDPMLKDLIERAAAIFDISYGGNGRVLSEKHPSLFPVKCPQLNGGGYFLSDETNALGLHFAGMGLPNSRNQPVYGLNLDQTVFDRRDAARALTSFKSPARKTLVKHLLQNEVTHEQAEHYLASHKFMPGYPQSDWAAHNFILTGILKNMNNNQLLVNCDFVLPKNVIAKDDLVRCIHSLCGNVSVEIVTENGIKILNNAQSGAEQHRVRIFTGYYVDDDEYKHLYRMRTDIGLGSGDNTIALVLSSEQLPFFHAKEGAILRFLERELLYTINLVGKKDENLVQNKEKFEKLSKYLTLQYKFIERFQIERQDSSYIDLDEVIESNRNKLQQKHDKYMDYITELANLAKDPEVLEAWKIAHRTLVENYDYKKYFQAILAGALYLNNPITTQTLYNLVDKPFMHFHQLRQYFVPNEVDFLASPHGLKLLTRLQENESIPIDVVAHLLISYVKLSNCGSIYDSTFRDLVEELENIENDTDLKYSASELNTILFFHALKMLKHLPAPSQGINLSSAYLLRDLADALSIINKYGNDELKSAKRDLIEYSFRFRTSDIKFQNQLFELLSFGAQDEILQVLLNHEPFMIIMTDKNLDLLYQYVKYRENENTLSKPVASDMLNNIKAEIELRSPKPPHDRKPSRKKALQHTAEKKQHPENGNVGSTPKKSKKR